MDIIDFKTGGLNADLVKRFTAYLSQPWFANTNWEMVYNPDVYAWKHSVTPLTHIGFMIACVAAYVAFSHFLRLVMKDREPFSGRIFTAFVVLHNAILSIGSLIMHIGVLYELYRMISKEYPSGNYFDAAVCDPKHIGFKGTGQRLGWWMYIFYLSKYYEMIDTFILALKKKPLEFLQMYHHSVIVFLCWSFIDGDWTLSWYAMAFNTLVHTFMYYYFAMQALKVHVWWKQWLTTGQLVQFFTVISLIIVWLLRSYQNFVFKSSWPFYSFSKSVCQGEPWSVTFSLLADVSFIYLFTDLFLRLYVFKDERRAKARAAAGAKAKSS